MKNPCEFIKELYTWAQSFLSHRGRSRPWVQSFLSKPRKVKLHIFVDDNHETSVLDNAPAHLKIGDCVTVQISNTSGGRANLRVRLSRTLLHKQFDESKPLLVMEVEGVLGFVDSERDGATGLFVSRPHAEDFLQFCSRYFNLATWTRTIGITILSKIVLCHPLVFAGTGTTLPIPDDIAAAAGCDSVSLSPKNVVYLIPNTHDVDNVNIVRINMYNKNSSKDKELMENSEIRILLRSISCSIDIDMFMTEK